MKNYHFFVCRNGYGHQKRVFSVVAELVKYSECSIITIHCNKETFMHTRLVLLVSIPIRARQVEMEEDIEHENEHEKHDEEW